MPKKELLRQTKKKGAHKHLMQTVSGQEMQKHPNFSNIQARPPYLGLKVF